MADYDDLPYIVIERRSGGVTPFLWGALLGAGAALFLAPRSGAETQDELRRSVMRVRGAAEDRVNNVRETVTGRVSRARDRTQDRLDMMRETFETRAARAREAVETGRDAARTAREELERRVEDAKHAAGDAHGEEDDVIITDLTVDEIDERDELA